VRFEQSTAAWPADVRRHAMQLATAAFEDGAAELRTAPEKR
jgi:hypothetical protein